MSPRCGIRSPERSVPGAAPISTQRLRMLTPHQGLVLNQAVRRAGSGQFAILGGLPLSAVLTTPFPAAAAAPPNPHRPRTTCRSPRVPSSEAFGRRPLPQSVSQSCRPASETLHETGPCAMAPEVRVSTLSSCSRTLTSLKEAGGLAAGRGVAPAGSPGRVTQAVVRLIDPFCVCRHASSRHSTSDL